VARRGATWQQNAYSDPRACPGFLIEARPKVESGDRVLEEGQQPLPASSGVWGRL